MIHILKNHPSIDYTQDIYNFEAHNPNRGKINPKVFGKENAKVLKHQEKYILNNAKTKTVELYGKNSLITENTNYNRDFFEKGKEKVPKYGWRSTCFGRWKK